MRVECLELKRCCCCIPLRYGLLVAGYLKLLFSVLMFIVIAREINLVFIRMDSIGSLTTALSILCVLLVIFLADIALTIVFLIGGHKKDVKLLKIYNYYVMGFFVLNVLGLILFHAAEMYFIVSARGFFYAIMMLRPSMVVGLMNVGYQVYMILLIKSEITKLENNCKFRFTNPTNGEAQCKIDEEGNETIGTSMKNNETVDQFQTVNENENNEQTENKKNGNYVRLHN